MIADNTTGSNGATVNKNIVLVIVTTISFIMPFLVAAVSVALPTMGREFDMDAVAMSWVSTVYFLATAVIQVPCGRLADIFGRKKLLILGMVISIFSSFLVAFASSVPMLIISRALQGAGAGTILNNGLAILTTTTPATERGRALGISMAGTYGGLSLGPLIGGFLTEHFGWPSIFLLSGILSIALIIMVFLTLKGDWVEAAGEKFDLVGSIAFGISVASFMYGFSALLTVTGMVLFAIGILGFLFFVRWESRTTSPVFNLGLFRKNRVFVFSNIAAIVTYIASFAVNFNLSLYLQYIQGRSPQTAGLILVVPAVLMTIFTPLSGRLSDRIEPRLVASTGNMFLCVSLLLFIFLGNETSLGYVIVALAFNGTGMGLFSSPNSNAIMGSVGREVLGVAAGTLGTTRTAGMMLSMGIMMILFSIYMGQAEVTPEYYPQFLDSCRAGFTIFTVICLAGVFFQLAGRRTGRVSGAN
jgi:multidrug resistance protein